MAAFQRSSDLPGTQGTESNASPSRFELHSDRDWALTLERSNTEPVLVFKHSATCGISSHVLGDVDAFLSEDPAVPMGIVDVIEDRMLSDRIALQTGIRHESPQLIAFRHKKPVWHASHWSIDLDELGRVLADHTPSAAS